MSENWVFFPCAMGDDTAFVFVDIGVNETIDAEAPNHLASVRLKYKSPRDDGLPTQEEFDPVNAIEDQLQDFADQRKDWYVGRVTVAGHRYFHFYTKASEEEWFETVSSIANETGYDLGLAYNEDKEHKEYWNDLYPSPDDFQVISDMKVAQALEEHGDSGSASRPIEHWAYFESEEAAKPFVDWAGSDRFEVMADQCGKTDEGQYCVRLSHEGTIEISDITSHSIALRRKAEELGGRYDGWETQVVKD